MRRVRPVYGQEHKKRIEWERANDTVAERRENVHAGHSAATTAIFGTGTETESAAGGTPRVRFGAGEPTPTTRGGRHAESATDDCGSTTHAERGNDCAATQVSNKCSNVCCGMVREHGRRTRRQRQLRVPRSHKGRTRCCVASGPQFSSACKRSTNKVPACIYIFEI